MINRAHSVKSGLLLVETGGFASSLLPSPAPGPIPAGAFFSNRWSESYFFAQKESLPKVTKFL